MDRKKWYCNIFIKALVVLMCFVGAGICVDAAANLNQFYADEIYTEETQSLESLEYNGAVAFQTFVDFHVTYQNEAYIKSGALVKQSDLEEARERFKQRLSNDYYVAKEAYLKSTEGVEDEEELSKLEVEYQKEVKKLDSQIDLQVANFKDSLIREQLVYWEDLSDQYNDLSKKYDFFIYLSDGRKITNTSKSDSVDVVEHFTSLPFYDTYNIVYVSPYMFGYAVSNIPEAVSEMYVGINQEYYDEYQQRVHGLMEENSTSKTIDTIIYEFMFGGLLFCVGALYLMIVAGRNDQTDELTLTLFDGLYMDIYTVVTAGVVLLLGWLITYLTYNYYQSYEYLMYYLSGLAALLATLLLFYLTTLAKRIKSRTLIKHTFVYATCAAIFNFFAGLFRRYSLNEKNVDKQINRMIALMMVIVLGFFVGADVLLHKQEFAIKWLIEIVICALPLFIIARLLVMRYVKDLNDIKIGAKHIREGNLAYKIPQLKNGSLNEVASDINRLSEGLKNSVSEAVASEKTKVELVTNVSHDIKTPLTSIINYIDLLSKRDIQDEEARHYIEVVSMKSNQLKKLVEDLFEITKAQNGQIDVDITEICIDDLLSQSLAEYEEDFEKKGLEVRFLPLESKSIVYADGNKMYRVLSNLFGNIVKYALDHTRVYIQFEEMGENLAITFKNIANYEMNFDGIHVADRFIRGDAARSSEGNGLGLAIAKSFLELQGDTLVVTNDGDLFKVTVYLHKKVEVNE